MPTITPEIRQAIEQSGGQPVRLEDPETRELYVLMKAGDYDRLNRADDEEDRRLAESTFRGIQEVFDDWNDPSMDMYNDLDPRR